MINIRIGSVVAAVMALAVGVATPAMAASFDCTRAGSPVERTICANLTLSHLDEQLNTAYRDRVAGLYGPAAQSLRHSQRDWLRGRDRCGIDAACIERAYRSRLAVLTTSAPAPAVDDGSGPVRLDFSSNYGPMTLWLDLDKRTVTGTYTSYNGHFHGTIDPTGRFLSGIWSQPGTENTCPTMQYGSHVWGRFRFHITDKPAPGDPMTGVWGYCDAKPASDWSGKVVPQPGNG